jgi:type I restriction enzyme M protein
MLARERFVVPEGCTFDDIIEHKKSAKIGEFINNVLEQIEEANKIKLEGVFRNIDFNSEANLGQTKERNRRLEHLINDFNNPALDLRPSRVGQEDIIGNAYEYLIARFASDAGKKGGEFYTPTEVAILLAKLLKAKKGDRICDPACGSGSLLIRVAQEIRSKDFSLYGQEINGATWALARMNMFLHDMDNARIEWSDTINNPKLIEKDKLMTFDIVVANPPFSLDKWGHENAAGDPFGRFHRGVPPKSKGDFAFISHMIETAHAKSGKVGVVVPHGVLFRGSSEGAIRQRLIEENYLDAVIGLPSNLFYGTGIPAAILIFDKGKKSDDVLFIDASREFQEGKNQNKLRDEDIQHVLKVFTDRKAENKYSAVVSMDQIRENEFNLNIPRYVDTAQEEEQIDIKAVQKEIERIEERLAETRKEMNRYLKELGL